MNKKIRSLRKKITVAIIIPVFNRQKLLEKALDSILLQTSLPEEVVIVDDHSIHPVYIKKKYLTLNIKLIRNRFNKGVCMSRNIGINHAKSDYCAFLDSDDFYSIKKIELQKEIAEIYDANFIYGRNIILNGNKRSETNTRYILKKNSYKDLLFNFQIPNTSTLFISRILLKNLGGFDESLATGEDYDLWIRAAYTGANFYYVKNAISFFNQHNDSRLSLEIEKRFSSINRLIENRRAEGLDKFSLYLFCAKYSAVLISNLLIQSFKLRRPYIISKISKELFNYPFSLIFILWILLKKIFDRLIKLLI